jgi:hypothetical protein
MGLDEPRAADHSLGFIGIGAEANPFKEVNQELQKVSWSYWGSVLPMVPSSTKKRDNLSRILVPNQCLWGLGTLLSLGNSHAHCEVFQFPSLWSCLQVLQWPWPLHCLKWGNMSRRPWFATMAAI